MSATVPQTHGPMGYGNARTRLSVRCSKMRLLERVGGDSVNNNMDLDRSLLVYDGDCAFCAAWVQRLEKGLGRFPAAQPYQWLDLEALGLTERDVTSAAWLFVDGQSYRGHAAFGELLRMQPAFGLRFLGSLLMTPPFSWGAKIGYFLIARFRHRLPGGTPTCAMPKANG